VARIGNVLSRKVVEMTRTRLILCAALAVCVWLTACGPKWYSIALTPNGPVMERKITQSFGPEELERVALLYSQDIDAATLAKFEKSAEAKTSLSGDFAPAMPFDSHNRGVYLYCDSPLGSAAVYTERFGGRHDLAAMLSEQEKAFNVLWDVLLLQLDALVGDSTDYATLRSFLDTTMRADAWDLALETTLADLGADATRNLSVLDDMPDDVTDKFMRALHFLDARGYLTLQEALELLLGELDEDDWYPLLVKTLGESVGRRMGLEDGAMHAAFEALMDIPQERFDDEMERLFGSDERIVGLLAEFRRDLDGMSSAEPSRSMNVVADRAFLFDFDLLDISGDARDVTLYIPVEPYMTNGAWVEARETVVTDSEDVLVPVHQSLVEWEYPLASVPPGGDLAQVVYAFWAEPNEAYQVERFGLVVSDGDSLANQCRWRQMLGPSLRDEWDAFIDGLRPGPELADTLREFRFSIEEPRGSDDPDASRSQLAREVTRHLSSKVESEKSGD
jgi:hypothetical protein